MTEQTYIVSISMTVYANIDVPKDIAVLYFISVCCHVGFCISASVLTMTVANLSVNNRGLSLFKLHSDY